MSPGKWKGSTRRSRLPKDWPVRRARILARDGYRCTVVEGGVRCPNRATEVDHVKRGDDHSDGNLRSICDDHHRAKSSREGNAARVPLRRPAERHPGLVQ